MYCIRPDNFDIKAPDMNCRDLRWTTSCEPETQSMILITIAATPRSTPYLIKQFRTLPARSERARRPAMQNQHSAGPVPVFLI